jgi:hypothetical protein
MLFCRKLWRGKQTVLPDNKRNKNNYDFPEKTFKLTQMVQLPLL